MKKIIIYFFPLFLVIACTKKEETTNSGNSSNSTITVITSNKSQQPTTFTYDYQGKIIKASDPYRLISINGNDTITTFSTYTYYPDKLLRKRYEHHSSNGKDSLLAPTKLDTLNLDANGRLSSYPNTTITFNALGYVDFYSNPSRSYTASYTNENLSSEIIKSGGDTAVYNFGYYTDHLNTNRINSLNPNGDFIHRLQLFTPICGLSSKHLLQSINSTKDKVNITFTYKFDNKGRVIMIVANKGTKIDSTSIVYN